MFSAIALLETSFVISNPTSYVFSRTSATLITFEAGLVNADATDVSITSYELYLSDNDDLSAGGAKVSTAIAIQSGAPTTVPASASGASGNGLTTGMTANIQIASGTDCSSYTKLCLKVTPGDSTKCIDITGKTNCAGK